MHIIFLIFMFPYLLTQIIRGIVVSIHADTKKRRRQYWFAIVGGFHIMIIDAINKQC